MDNENIKAVVNHALSDNPSEMKGALYDAINDKIMAAIESKKMEMAASLFSEPTETEIEPTEVEQAE